MHLSRRRLTVLPAAPAARAIDRLPSFPTVAAEFAVLIGCLVLLGWTFDVAVLKSLVPGLVAMNPATALAFILAGASLWMLDRTKENPRAHLFGLGAGAIVAVVGLVKLINILTGWDLGIDQLLFHDSLRAVGGQVANRMAPNTATAFLFIGLALVCLYLEPRLDQRISQAFSLVAIIIASLAVIGYIYGVPALSGLSSYIHMALNTALVFVMLSLGLLLARSDRGIMAVFTSTGPGGAMARAQLPIAILVPIVLGWFRLKGQELRLYNTDAGVSLAAVYSIYVSVLLIWVGARALDRLDAERRRAERAEAEVASLEQQIEDMT